MGTLFDKNEAMSLKRPIEPFREMVAYEALWRDPKASYKWLAELFARNPGMLPSDLIGREQMNNIYSQLKDIVLGDDLLYRYYLLIYGTFDFPTGLRDAKEPLEIVYYSGNLDHLGTRRIAIVGTRKPTAEGLQRTEQLTKKLVKDNFTIVSGLAMGIDTKAHQVAIAEGGKTIGVIGTPLDTFYPLDNKELQTQIAKEHLLFSQVPFVRYKEQTINGNRLFFPERNKTMSALTEATIIVEASDTSGTLIQAKAALQQGRRLFILDNCFHNTAITWPAKYEKQGAIRVKHYEEIIQHLNV
jgi:DNA processing protein